MIHNQVRRGVGRSLTRSHKLLCIHVYFPRCNDVTLEIEPRPSFLANKIFWGYVHFKLEAGKVIANFYACLGCEGKTTFSRENADKRVPTVNIGDRREISMRYWPWEYYRCSLNISSSWIMGCNGTKHFLTPQYYNAAKRLFTISRRNLASRYILQVRLKRNSSWLTEKFTLGLETIKYA